MFIVANRVPVTEAFEEMFEARFQARSGQIEKQPGFVRMQVLKPSDPDTPYIVLTSWQDKAAFENWVGSDDFRQAHANPMPKEAFAGEGAIEMHEVIIEAESAKAN
ncbi:MAG: antibiotic biosynthesis monooxygenase [Candidatus Thiodiazotropha weberae]|uniref:Antibiotic biosynthesis monooxygenase n=1 Tax=Candidatus Thiodiazotropha endoloripes TaxID=1818881 RepID=A0A1E2UHP4_9GAMM|nr:antibiotic biosynthesis monooxygenase [Candidatus Thiodiazotropha endoloripes]MCG7897259.1 antibiotic biosynthesis monooxygenase [Candidatus Thiodiazotropha weberae]ODB92880.1 antibiotic biosynthesis monooxygenase [Candidatus Thiodiazotropha endoloripes]